MTSTGDRYPPGRPESGFAWGAYELESWPPAVRIPDVEILELERGARVLDLGCGNGDNAAQVAGLGLHVTAIDQSAAQVTTARQRWGHVPRLTVMQAEAIAFLLAVGQIFDVIYSVYGAAWFTDPEALVPAAFAALRPGGVFACSHADVDPPMGKVTLNSAPEIQRWELSPLAWRMLLRANGFREAVTRVLPPTRGFPDKATILVTGRR